MDITITITKNQSEDLAFMAEHTGAVSKYKGMDASQFVNAKVQELLKEARKMQIRLAYPTEKIMAAFEAADNATKDQVVQALNVSVDAPTPQL